MRKYGQHFLISERIISGIIEAVPGQVTDVLEIGPGRGALTEKLLVRDFEHFTAVEIDPDMQTYLLENFPKLEGHIVREDFLKFDLHKLPARPTFFVSNLPYIDAAAILDKVLSWPYFSGAVFMFQKEQAQRILAKPGQEGYGPLSVLTQVRACPRLLLKVGKACFNPPPKVESTVLIISPITWPLDRCLYERFARFVKAAFLHRRKTLFNSLALAGYDKARVQNAFASLQLTATVRPEQLTCEQYIQLFPLL